MPTEFDHITVPSRDLEKSIAFYQSLGMELIEYERHHHAHFENKEHEVIFTIYFNQKRPEYEVTVYFEVTAIWQLQEYFSQTEKASFPKTDWDGYELHLLDPDQNHVILYQKFSAETIPPWQQKSNES